MRWISVDPGTRAHGIAQWRGARLVRAGLICSSAVTLAERAAGLAAGVADHPLVCEIPQDRGQDRVPPADLIALGVCVGALLPGREWARLVTPAGWKGTVPKRQHQESILAILSQGELAALGGERDHNVLDGIGIGLWALGRLKGGRDRKLPDFLKGITGLRV